MSLAEAFAFYNRISLMQRRSGDKSGLISPRDLKEALSIVEKSKGGYPIRIEQVSRNKLIVKKEASFDAIINSTVQKLKDGEYITPMMIQTRCGLPNTIARDYLLRAEQQGLVAKDDSLAGFRFYKNLFPSFGLMKL